MEIFHYVWIFTTIEGTHINVIESGALYVNDPRNERTKQKKTSRNCNSVVFWLEALCLSL